jgi:hypothetical protein
MRNDHVNQIVPLLAALRTGQYQTLHGAARGGGPRPPAPFVTISRQAGAGGRSFAKELARRLNERDPGDLPWTVWDNELVERVAAEHHLPLDRVMAMEDERPSWLETALGSLAATRATADEPTVFRRVAATIRALAELGRVVIVGRGSAFVTADMPGGVHVRLVAPQDRRIDRAARSMAVSPAIAADWVRDTDAAREAFYRRHFPGRPLTPENFTATFNTAAESNDRLVDAAVALVLAPAENAAPALAIAAS